jgi:hypothetical protein
VCCAVSEDPHNNNTAYFNIIIVRYEGGNNTVVTYYPNVNDIDFCSRGRIVPNDQDNDFVILQIWYLRIEAT